MITGITFDLQNVLSKNDGRLYQAIFGSDYILSGCACSATDGGASIQIAEGYVAVGGRVVHFDGGEKKTITPTLTTGHGRLIIDVDLTKASTADEFKQVSLVEQYSTTQTFPELTQNDINLSGTHYQAELCRFPISSSAAGNVAVTLPNFNAERTVGALLPFASETYDFGKSDNRFKVGYFKGLNVSTTSRFSGVLNADGGISVPDPQIVTASAISKVNLTKNNIFKIPGAAIYQIYGQFSEGNDGIPSGGAVASAVPSAYCPQTNFDCYCFAQTHAGNILRATATISSGGLVTITTQGGTAFHYFRIDAIIPQGM